MPRYGGRQQVAADFIRLSVRHRQHLWVDIALLLLTVLAASSDLHHVISLLPLRPADLFIVHHRWRAFFARLPLSTPTISVSARAENALPQAGVAHGSL